MRPAAFLSVLALTCSVLATPTEFERHAGNVDVRGVPIRHNHRSHSHQTRGDRSSGSASAGKKMKKRSTQKKKRCVAKSSTSLSAATSTASAASKTQSASAHATTTASSSSSGSSSGGSSGGVATVNDPTCGPNDPSAKPGKGTGPNGSQAWMNCGLNTSKGWTPPMLKLEELVYVKLSDALAMSNSQFSSCKSLVSIFEAKAKEYGLPDIMLAAIAMQESSCSPDAYSAGSTGLFQLSSDLCKPYGSNCKDPTNNTDGGAKYLKGLIDQYGGNVLEAMGAYNGWYRGIKPSDVQNMPCAERQNWNYLQGNINGFMLGIDGYSNGNVDDGCQGADSD